MQSWWRVAVIGSDNMASMIRWEMFISELRAYIEEHHLCPPKHTKLYNSQKYYRRKQKEGTLDSDKSKELNDVLAMRDLSIHTGGKRKCSC
jgi:hypothetical protein